MIISFCMEPDFVKEAVKMIAAGKKKGKFLVKVRRAFRRPLVGLCLLGETDYSEYAYTNDALGRRTSKNDEQYGYNARGELIRVSPSNDSVGHYEYAPFGAVKSAVGIRTEDNPFRYSSEFCDVILGLSYYNYRHYNPKDGRWTVLRGLFKW